MIDQCSWMINESKLVAGEQLTTNLSEYWHYMGKRDFIIDQQIARHFV